MRENFIGQILGGYLLEDVINSGGMATVYKGLHMQTHRVVAVKVLPAYFAHDPQFLRRFRREAKAVSMLQHPHIVRVHAAGESDGLPYMIMEYVGGGTFSDLLANGRLTWEGAAVLISQVASALTYAHAHGVVHRDVKPSNVLLAQPDFAKLSDFGIAKLADEGTTLMTALTATGIGVGTAAYMAPEQATEAANADARADVYALGVMLYQIVSGRLPYNADTPMGLLAQHIYEPVPAVRRDAPNVPEVIERILFKALAKDPDKRFQSAEALAEVFAAAVAGQLVTIELPSAADLNALPDATLPEQALVAPPPTEIEMDVDDISDLDLQLDPKYQAAFRAALAAYDADDLDRAKRLLNDMLRADEHLAEAWLLLSFIEQNHYDQMQCAENALAVAPDMEDARLRIQQLEAERLPATFGRSYSVIPAVKVAHDQAMDRYFTPSTLEDALDPLDNPDQCPYCGTVNEASRNNCKHCGESMMRSLPPHKVPVPALRLALSLNLGSIVLLLAQMVPPLLWTWYLTLDDPSRLKMFIDDIFAQPIAHLVLGNFTEVLEPTLFIFLMGVGVVRLLMLLVVAVGLRTRWAWAYYLGFVTFGLEAIWGFLAMGLGWTGIVIGFVAAGIALGGFTALSAASVNFTVNSQRYRVLPEGRLKSGIAFLKLGKEYQRMGMWAMAVAQYRAAVAAAPDRAEHYKALGIGYNKLGRTDRALRALEQAVRLDPSDVEARTLVKRLRRTDDRPAPAPAAER